MAGSDYASLSNVDEAAGSFKVKFTANESVAARTVLVRVTSTCTSQYKDFMYSQAGIECTTYTPPTLGPAGKTLSLCSGGAVILSVPVAYANLSKVIWTRNGIEVARGVNYYVATLKGTYNVSVGAAGCNVDPNNEHVVTDSDTVAPSISGTLVTASNNGIICGTGGNITLSILGTKSGDAIFWYRNGSRQTSQTGTQITTNLDGVWFAMINSGSCLSKPTNSVNVSVNSASEPITVADADVLVNEKPIKNITSFCSGGSLTLRIKNPQDGVNYTWYNGQTVITSPYIVPSQTTMQLRMVATDVSGAKCAAEASTTEIAVTSGATPTTPTITGSGVVCDGSADLTVVPAQTGTYTYQWYKNGVLLSNTTQTITATEPGAVYSATVATASGCTSPYATKTIAAEVSSLPTISWVSTGTTANFNDKITYQLAIEHGPATYAWKADGGATVTGSGTNATVTFPSSGSEVNIEVVATNGCGASTALTKKVLLSALCPTPVVAEASGLVQNTTAGTGATVKVTVTNANTTTYQWYKNTTNSNSGGDAISGATTASYIYTPDNSGTTYLYCIVQNGCTGLPTATSKVFTVVASANPTKMDLGSGTFAGKTCFDINKSNDGGNCGTKSSRTANATDFASQYAQPYVFTASTTGTKKDLRFVIVDPSGVVESSNAATAGISGTINNSQTATLTVNYKKTLSNTDDIIYGKTTSQAVKVQIYAVYNDGAKDVSVPLNVSIQDCACCGAYVAAGVWKNFMCHNLGADTTADPFTPSAAINGSYYQWGRSTPEIEVKNNGTEVDKGFKSVIAPSGSWSDSSKTSNDPCPAGYRIPTFDQIKNLSANNEITSVGTDWTNNGNNFSTGTKIGSSLFVPMNGWRGSDVRNYLNSSNRGYYAYLWTTTLIEDYGYFLSAGRSSISNGAAPKLQGIGIRCIAE